VSEQFLNGTSAHKNIGGRFEARKLLCVNSNEEHGEQLNQQDATPTELS